MATRKTTRNTGKRTAGVDGETWSSSKTKMEAALRLTDKQYVAKPLKRVFIEKPGKKKKRPLGIPTMYDRAMQSLYAMALEPIAEATGDRTSFGFRKLRSTHDACEQVFVCMSGKHSSEWVLEGDIKGCFDNISHQWLIDNIPMDKSVLRQFLKAGYIFERQLFPTEAGTPQGGIISPILAKRLIKDFLKDRGLELSDEKTIITHIDNGFDFLGWNFRKYNGKLLVKPSNKSIEKVTENISDIIKRGKAWKKKDLIKYLNPVITGCEKSNGWVAEKYWHSEGGRNGVFSGGDKKLKLLSDTKIVRHMRLKLDMNPYLDKDYFIERKIKQGIKKLKSVEKSVWGKMKNVIKPGTKTMTINCCPN